MMIPVHKTAALILGNKVWIGPACQQVGGAPVAGGV